MALAIVTGASSGIGREFVRRLRADAGIDEFWLIARNEERLSEVAREAGCPAKIISADLATREGIEKVARALEEERPRVKFFVSAAGFGTFGAFDALPEETVERMIDLNVKATVLLTHRIIPYMERGGHIVEMGSGSCFTPLPSFNIYASSKAFVLHYTKALFYECKPYGVSATCFCPGWVDTAFLPKSKNTAGRVPKSMKPLLSPERVVRGAVRAAMRGKKLYVTNWYTKLQHLLFKFLPDGILTRAWCGMLTEPEKNEKGEG